MNIAAPAVNPQRFWQSVENLSAITETDRPWTRRSFTPLFLQGRDWLRAEFEKAGLRVHVDAAGNMIGRRDGADARLGVIMVGSHSDSVPRGGRFDGIAGVLAGLELARSFHDAGRTLRHGLEIVDFLAEEPSDYGLSCIGSRGITGFLDAAMLRAVNPKGETLAEGLRRMHGDPDKITKRSDVAVFFELHIEQGAVLEAEGLDLGIVTGIVGITRLGVTFTGQSAHAGTTPMDLRRDAMAAAAQLMHAVRAEAERLARDKSGYFVATAGQIDVTPNAANVVPGKARVVFDIRSDRREVMLGFLDTLHGFAAEAARAMRVELKSIERISDTTPAPCDSGLMNHLRMAARTHGFSHRDMTSGAGHDCAFLSHIAPSAMLFVPSKDGKSHCPEEWTSPEQFAKGLTVLHDAVLAFDAAASAKP